MPDTNNTDPILLPTPVAVVHQAESRFSVMAKFLSWLTALTLSVSVLVALVSVTNQRNDLSNQLSCRANANFDASKASYNKQIALADHSVLIGKFVTIIIEVSPGDPERELKLKELATSIEQADIVLERASNDLREAVHQQEIALVAC